MPLASDSLYDAIIIGAGISGLVVASILSDAGYKVCVLEARDRIGGRIHSLTKHGLLTESGAEMLHGKGSVAYSYVQKAGLTIVPGPNQHHYLSRKSHYDPASSFAHHVEAVFERLSTLYREDLSLAEAIAQSSADAEPEVIAMVDSMVRSLEGADDLTSPRPLSVRGLGWKGCEDTFLPENFLVKEGYQALAQRLAVGLEVRLSSPVTTIHWSKATCRVETPSQSLIGKVAIVTVPLGVLKKEALSFYPSLPVLMTDAIRAIGMSSHVKMVFYFKERWWPFEGFLETDGMIGSWWGRGDIPVLSTLTGGNRARTLADMNPRQRTQFALKELSSVWGPACLEGLLSVDFINWIHDPWALGGYSHNTVGMGNARKVLATPIEGRLFFAGEATCFDGDHATVHGAIESAERCAREALLSLDA
jgi:monoamine oxidase